MRAGPGSARAWGARAEVLRSGDFSAALTAAAQAAGFTGPAPTARQPYDAVF